MALRKLVSQSFCLLSQRTTGGPVTSFAAAGEPVLRAAALRAYSSVIEGIKFAKTHEYAKVDGDIATVGITEFAQSELGDVVYVELPEVGSEVEKGSTFGVVESVKAASDVYSPVSGEVVDVNSSLSDDPSQVNSAPMTSGWIMKVKMSKPAELNDLLDKDAYTSMCDSGH